MDKGAWQATVHGVAKESDIVREGEGGKIWENGIETCKISCMK